MELPPPSSNNNSNNSNNYNNDDDDDDDEWNYKEEEIAHKFFFFNVLKDGRIHMLPLPFTVHQTVPPSDDPTTGVKIKDVVVSSHVSVRMFLPASACASSTAKLPVVFYVHGGGFCICSAFSEDYTRLLTRLVDECDVIGVSVEYGLFPTRPLPACYEDSWFALTWLASHASDQSIDSNIGARDPWITDYADLSRIFVGGDSAGGNISHTLSSRVGKIGLPKGAKVEGMILIHPYFDENDEMWMYMCPTNEGPRDPRMKPSQDDLARLGCNRVLILVAEKDFIRKAGVEYVEELKRSGYRGGIEFFETKDREHCFHISNYDDCEAIAMNHKIKSFIHHC